MADTIFGKKAVYHNGSIFGFTTNIYRIEEDNTCIILLNNITNSKIDKITKDLLDVLYEKKQSEINSIYKEILLNENELNEFVQTFKFSPQFKMKIFVENKKLYAQRLGEQQTIAIYPFEKNKFYAKSKDAILIFDKINSTNYNQLTLSQGGKTMVGIILIIDKGWGLLGDALSVGWEGKDIKLVEDPYNSNKWTIKNLQLKNGEMKFRLDSDWSVNYGSDNNSTMGLKQDGDNIKVFSGVYDVVLDLSNPFSPKYSISRIKD